MSLVDSIAAFSTAKATAEVQFQVAARVLKIAQNTQGQIATDLLAAATETMEQAMAQVQGDAGQNFDTLA